MWSEDDTEDVLGFKGEEPWAAEVGSKKAELAIGIPRVPLSPEGGVLMKGDS